LINLAEIEFALGNYDKAAGWYEQAGKRLPHNSLILFRRYLCYSLLNDRPKTEMVMKELREQFPAAREAKLLKSVIVKIPESVYKAVPGVDKFRPDQVSPIENFFLCGDYTYQNYLASMEGAALSGKHVAEKLDAKMKHRKQETPVTA